VIATAPVENVTLERLEKIMPLFSGEIQQIPPMYSAIKQNGTPLYELARKGITVERKPRSVHIYHLQLMKLEENRFELEVHCSKGTYIRTLVEDIGDQLGCGAHVTELRRLAVAPYEQQMMYSLTQLSEVVEREGIAGLKQFLLPVETALQKLPTLKLMTDSAYYFKLGQPVRIPALSRDHLIRVFSEEGQFLGIGEILEDGRLAPKRLVVS